MFVVWLHESTWELRSDDRYTVPPKTSFHK